MKAYGKFLPYVALALLVILLVTCHKDIFAAQVPIDRPLPDALASLVIKELSVAPDGRIEKLVFRAEYFSRLQVPGQPIKPTLKGAVEFDLVKLGDQDFVLTHADALNGNIINRHFSANDVVLMLKVVTDLQWFQTMPPAPEAPLIK